MPTVNLRTQVSVPLWIDVEAEVVFGDPGGTYAVEGFKIVGVDGVNAKLEMISRGSLGMAPVANLVFSPGLHELIFPLVEDELVEEAKR